MPGMVLVKTALNRKDAYEMIKGQRTGHLEQRSEVARLLEKHNGVVNKSSFSQCLLVPWSVVFCLRRSLDGNWRTGEGFEPPITPPTLALATMFCICTKSRFTFKPNFVVPLGFAGGRSRFRATPCHPTQSLGDNLCPPIRSYAFPNVRHAFLW